MRASLLRRRECTLPPRHNRNSARALLHVSVVSTRKYADVELPKPSISVACNHVVNGITNKFWYNSKQNSPMPPWQFAQDAQHRIGAKICFRPGYEHKRIRLVWIDAETFGQITSFRRLNGHKAKLMEAVTFDDKVI